MFLRLDESQNILFTDIKGAIDYGSSFFITCDVTILDRQALSGAPLRISQKTETTFYIADVRTKRIYESVTIASEGIGKSENQAFMNSFSEIDVRSSKIKNFVNSANKKIIDYYESQVDHFISLAEGKAKLGAYDEALHILSEVPDVCPSYGKVCDAALRIYQIMIDKSSLEALQAAKAVWASAHTYEGATKAANFLALVSPYSSCIQEAENLFNEIKDFVTKEHAYDKEWKEKVFTSEQKLESENIRAWRDVGVAYGNNQKQEVTYNRWW